MHAFTIGYHRFPAEDLVEATMKAIDKARELFRAGQVEEANRLHHEALMLRRIAQGHQRFTPLPRRASLRAARI